MSIALVVTRGFGAGSLAGSVSDIVTCGYAIGVVTSIWTERSVNAQAYSERAINPATYNDRVIQTVTWSDR